MTPRKIIAFCLLAAAWPFALAGAQTNEDWTECGTDVACAEQTAGFSFPLQVTDYTLRAARGLLEISFPLDTARNVRVIKTETEPAEIHALGEGLQPALKESPLQLPDGITVTVFSDNQNTYLMHFGASGGFYTAYCLEGLTTDDMNHIYRLIAEAETPHLPDY